MAETDWQARKSLAETNLFMLENEVACDVTFLVGDQKEAVKAHKFMLVSRSCVFYAMLQGSLAETSDHITIPDIDKETFTSLLRFLYCEETVITADNVIGLLYAGKKYGVLALVDRCGEFLSENIAVDNVCTIFNHARYFDEDALKKTCLSFILRNGKDVLQSPGFLTLVPDCLRSVLESDLLDANEELVYTASMKWSVEECQRRKLEVSHENQRGVLGDMLYLIRFPIMKEKFFSGTVSIDNLLEDKEKLVLFRFMIDREKKDGFQFCDRERERSNNISQSLNVNRFSTFTSSWTFGGKPDAVSFTCSKDVLLLGVSVCTPLTGHYSGEMELLSENEVSLSTKNIKISQTENKTATVLLDEPVKLSAGMKYHVVQRCRGSSAWYGQHGNTTNTVNGLTVSFAKSDFDLNGTHATRGQIPGLLFGLQ